MFFASPPWERCFASKRVVPLTNLSDFRCGRFPKWYDFGEIPDPQNVMIGIFEENLQDC